MLSLYDIQEQLLGVLSAIEEQEGEITPEQEEYLKVTEDNFRTKLDNYAKVIQNLETFVETCKKEEKRIHNRRKVTENSIERLKKMILEAIKMFGVNGKTIETGTFRLTARTNKSVIVDEERVNKFKLAFSEFITEIVQNGMLGVDDDIDFDGMLTVINNNMKAECEDPDSFIPYTKSDLYNIKINIEKEATIGDMMGTVWGQKYLESYGMDISGHMEANVSKTDVKQNITVLNSNPSVAHIEETNSLLIK